MTLLFFRASHLPPAPHLSPASHLPPACPQVYVSPSLGDARKVEVTQFPEQGVKAGKAQNCLIIMNDAKGDIDCKLVTPSGKEDDVYMDKLDDEVHAVRFVPRDNGVHYFHVKCRGIQIPGSPFRLRVGEEEADPAACSASGKGLIAVETGVKADFIVDTCSAGAGTLAVTIDGPSKVSMDCTEVDNGYKVRYTPLVNGDYYIHVKYNNVHISGSPWKVGLAPHLTSVSLTLLL
ncbi:Filamin/ABP280 repeat-like, partial [Trinorchestia longiramus]